MANSSKISSNKGRKVRAARIVRDTMGEVEVPEGAYYGAQTMRAIGNFPVSGIMPKEVFIRSTAMVKYAAAAANTSLGLLDKKTGEAVMAAAKEVIDGRFSDEFVVDTYQAGAGTSHNMNANEVIASRASELLGGKRGDTGAVHPPVHPNDHVNMAQSTNDTFPTAMRVAILLSTPALLKSLRGLEVALASKGRAFKNIIKSGRTHLQDAVPVFLGSEFASYASAIGRVLARIKDSGTELKEIGLGGTAAGTGVNTHPLYRRKALKALAQVSGIKGLKPAPDLFEALGSMGSFAAFSGSLKEAAIELVRISNDLRLLSSGPATGFAEIKLPPVQPGSSIMPGKVNPVMAEMMAMVSFQVMGNDHVVSMAAQAGQFELNVMGPVINYNILQSIEILTTGVEAFTNKCVKGITADKERCRKYFESSEGLVTLLNRSVGYERAALILKESRESKKSLKEVIIEGGFLSEEEYISIFDIKKITGPS